MGKEEVPQEVPQPYNEHGEYQEEERLTAELRQAEEDWEKATNEIREIALVAIYDLDPERKARLRQVRLEEDVARGRYYYLLNELQKFVAKLRGEKYEVI
jgi:hypothetical protein